MLLAAVALLEARGLEAQLLSIEGAPSAVFAERKQPGAQTTLMLVITSYSIHYTKLYELGGNPCRREIR